MHFSGVVCIRAFFCDGGSESVPISPSIVGTKI